MEKLTAEQAALGQQMERMWVNYKKDSPSRKNTEYLAKKSNELEMLWTNFKDNHEKLTTSDDFTEDHPYHTEAYFEEVRKLYTKFRSSLSEATAALSTVMTSTSGPEATNSATTSTTTTATNATSANKPETPRSHQFKLTLSEDPQTGVDEEVVKLVRRQKAAMKTIIHLIRDVESKADQEHPQPYYKLKIKLLQDYEGQLTQNNQLIWERTPDEPPCGYEADLYLELTYWIHDTIVSLQQRLISLSEISPNSAPPHGYNS